MIVFEGEPLTYALPLQIDGDTIVPDNGSVSYTLYDHEGVVLINEIVTSTDIEIAPNLNLRNPLRDFEKRTIITRFTYNGKPYIKKNSYRVVPLVNYSTTVQDVRDFIGIDAQELPDHAVDLYKHYLTLSELVGQPLLDEALVAGTIVEMQANEALCMVAVLDVIPSLKQRVMYFEADGILQYRRQTIQDFDELARAASKKLAQLLATLSPVVVGSNTQPLLVVIGSVSDAVTGA